MAAEPQPQILYLPDARHDPAAPGDRGLRVWVVEGDDARPGPTLDADGLLRWSGRWVVIPDTQIPVVELLLRNLGRLVRHAELRAAYAAAGGSDSATSHRSLIHRLGRRVAEVGLALHVVRGRGVVLDTGG
jgi:hypothetical protein